MTADPALVAAVGLDVSRETVDRLRQLEALVLVENDQQNLISAGTIDTFWTRHILDSAQLLRFDVPGPWLDLGTGAGFPGLVVAILRADPVILCEERRLRHEFLARAVDALGLGHVTVAGTRVERLDLPPVAAISARAFAPLEKLFALAHRFSTEKTRWLLPKGQNAAIELESAPRAWHGEFRLEPSVTDPNSRIIVAENVRPKGQRR